ncbi:MAG: hypothetical protein IKG18_08780 [Atopobiaceae bacterium]|nr:hypothetical protein [Atopobiaceae bacterium]
MIRQTGARDMRTEKDEENMASHADRQAMLLEYVAMMADVELPEEEGRDVEVREG